MRKTNKAGRFVAAMVLSVWMLVGVVSVGSMMVGCQTAERTASANTFATLQAAATAIDSVRASYEQAAAAGTITAEQKHKLDVAYNKANDAIILAAKVLRDVGGLGAASPDEVNQAVASLVALLAEILPPKAR